MAGAAPLYADLSEGGQVQLVTEDGQEDEEGLTPNALAIWGDACRAAGLSPFTVSPLQKYKFQYKQYIVNFNICFVICFYFFVSRD